MQEAFLLGLTLIGALLFVMVFVTCGLIIAFRYKTREIEARAATAQRNRDEKVKRIHNRLSLKVWSSSEEEEEPDDIESNQVICLNASKIREHLDTKDSSIRSFETKVSPVCDQKKVPHRQQNVCAICLGKYHNGDVVVQSCNVNCLHEFHRECIVDWLAKKDECPCCRQSFMCKDVEATS